MKRTSEVELNEIINRVRKRDDVAFADLVRRYTPMINKVVSGFYSPTIHSNESFSEACVALYNAALSYDFSKKDVTFGLYARICVYRRMCDLFGKDLSSKHALIDDIDVETFPVSDVLEASIVGQELLDAYLLRAQEILSDYEYKVFILYLEGYSTAATATKLDKTSKSVDNAKSRLFRRLREERKTFPSFD